MIIYQRKLKRKTQNVLITSFFLFWNRKTTDNVKDNEKTNSYEIREICELSNCVLHIVFRDCEMR